MERWAKYKGLDGVMVSDCGRVMKDGEIVKPSIKGGHGYFRVFLCGKKLYVHRMVLETFKEQPVGKNYANHKNHNKTDNRICNLEWSTNRENMLLAAREGRFSCGAPHPTPVKVTWPDGRVEVFSSQKDASDAIGADKSGSSVNKALRGDRKTTHGCVVEYYKGFVRRPEQMTLMDFGIM